MIDVATLDFLSEAALDLGNEWLKDNRDRHTLARSNLIDFTARLHKESSLVDPRVRDANPDLRKCLSERAIARGNGRITFRVMPEKKAAATYFVNVSPQSSFSGGGALLPPPKLARILRQTIASHTGKWRGIVEGAVFQKYFPNGLTGGYDATSPGFVKNHDALDFFNLKSFGACRIMPESLLYSPRLAEESAISFVAARPLVDYINRSTITLV